MHAPTVRRDCGAHDGELSMDRPLSQAQFLSRRIEDGLALAGFVALAHDLAEAVDDAREPAVVPVCGISG
jgi:hypothetical protein